MIERIDRGLATVDEALGLVDRNHDRLHEAELHRIKGELLLDASRARRSEAEACFREAIAIARRRGARSLELRATTSLSRLLHQQRRTAAARDLLRVVHAEFSEGFQTPDLQDAAALLEELGPGG